MFQIKIIVIRITILITKLLLLYSYIIIILKIYEKKNYN